jgi:TolB-like protein
MNKAALLPLALFCSATFAVADDFDVLGNPYEEPETASELASPDETDRTDDGDDADNASASEQPAASTVPAVAVYVTGDNVRGDIKEAFAALLLDGLVNSGLYSAVERSETFLAAVEQEHAAQRSGAVDDDQIREIGKRAGVQFVCVASIIPVMDRNQISVRIIDVETAAISASGTASGQLGSLDDLKRGAAEAIYNMIGVRVKIDKDFELLTEREETILEQKIEQTIQQTIHSSKLTNKPLFWIGSSISLAGAGTIIYGLIENGNVVSHDNRSERDKGADAIKKRDAAYTAGAAILTVGAALLSISIFF